MDTIAYVLLVLSLTSFAYTLKLQKYRYSLDENEEWKPFQMYNGLVPAGIDVLQDIQYHQPPPDTEIPEEVDWRAKGVVTDVKNQYGCGSCWAFSATGALEGQLALKTKKLVSLSEQHLVDCDEIDIGCKEPGGHAWTAFKYIAKYGIVSEETYPYEGVKGECLFNRTNVVAKDKGWIQVHPTEKALKKAVAMVGPISVEINVTNDFRSYKKGIYKSSECSSDSTRSDHCVLVVGYGTTDEGEDYWLVKNSWGTGWGEDGYIRMARNHNMCGIANSATYPIL